MPQLSEGEARERLATAIAERDHVRGQLDFARRRLSDARDKYDECEFAAASFLGVGAKIIEWDIQAFNAGLDPVGDLPEHLRHARQDHSSAKDRLERATAVRDRIQTEVVEVERQLDAANQIVTFGVHLVVFAIARQLVTELDDLELAAHELRQRIVSLQLPGRSLPDDLVRRAFSALKPVQGDDQAKAEWGDLVARLHDDPHAH